LKHSVISSFTISKHSNMQIIANIRTNQSTYSDVPHLLTAVYHPSYFRSSFQPIRCQILDHG